MDAFLTQEQTLGRHDSSGRFTVETQRARRLFAEHLTAPEEQVLRLVQLCVLAGAKRLRLHLRARSLDARVQGGNPEILSSALDGWAQVSGRTVSLRLSRDFSQGQLAEERRLLRERCAFAPLALGPLQERNSSLSRPPKGSLVGANLHLAEVLFGEGSGLWFMRRDMRDQLPGPQTLCRELVDKPDFHSLDFPRKIAGVTARRERQWAAAVSAVAVLGVQPEGPGQAIPVVLGVASAPLSFSLPGVTLIFDASKLPTDLSGLRPVQGPELEAAVQVWATRVHDPMQRLLAALRSRMRGGQLFERQNRREIAAMIGVLSVGALAGALPLVPVLALPWLVWHENGRKRSLARLEGTLQELQVFLRGPTRIAPREDGPVR